MLVISTATTVSKKSPQGPLPTARGMGDLNQSATRTPRWANRLESSETCTTPHLEEGAQWGRQGGGKGKTGEEGATSQPRRAELDVVPSPRRTLSPRLHPSKKKRRAALIADQVAGEYCGLHDESTAASDGLRRPRHAAQ